MIEILERLHKYISTVTKTKDGKEVEIICEFTNILLGKSKLGFIISPVHWYNTWRPITCARIWTRESEVGLECLQGIVSVTKDWHAKMWFGKGYTNVHLVLMGTLNTNLEIWPIEEMQWTCEEFFTTVIEAHILAVAMSAFGMSSLDDKPTGILFTERCCDLDKKEKDILFYTIANVIDIYLDMSYCEKREF